MSETCRTNGYDTVHAVDFYHSMTQIPGFLQDAAVYLDGYRKTLQLQTTKKRPFVVLDVCTGTGRVIRDLVAHLSEHDADLHATKFIGLDISRPMLDQAAKLPLASPTADVTWIEGSALNLHEVPAFRDGVLKADLLIVAFSSISHFIEPGQVAQFLREVARVLQPGTGRAYISLRDIPATFQSDMPPAEGDTNSTDLPSLVLPGITYRQIGNDVQVKDGVVYVVSNVQVMSGKGDTLSTESATTAFRILGDDELRTLASSVGLDVVETVQAGEETYYVFQSP
ncbi:hypothetical protein APSETT444_005141 [Aspergillus pseudonomiae]